MAVKPKVMHPIVNCCEKDYDYELGVMPACVMVGEKEFQNPGDLMKLIVSLVKAHRWLKAQK